MRLQRSIAALSALPLLALAGCGNTPEQVDGGQGGDAEVADPAPTAPIECPDELAQAEGVAPPADMQAPTWPTLGEGLLCTYTLGDTWTLEGEPQPLGDDDLGAVVTEVAALRPVPPGQLCTREVGPRHLVVAASDEGTVALVVEAFGCRDVYFTSDPASVPAGEADTALAPSGRFSPTPALLQLVGAGR